MITKEKFIAYVKVQHSGITNMYAVNKVVKLSKNVLTEKDCFEIMRGYAYYKDKYMPDYSKIIEDCLLDNARDIIEERKNLID
jgi:hypothetical protein